MVIYRTILRGNLNVDNDIAAYWIFIYNWSKRTLINFY